VAGNAGLFVPKPGWLEFLRQITQENGALLIFDEVMTGFRLAPGGAQERFGITPDISTFGKIIGGGLPVGAFGGRADIMDYLAPVGPVYQAGTLSGNPLAMAAGIAAIGELGIQAAPKRISKKDTMAIAKLTGVKPSKFGNRTQALPYVHPSGKVAPAAKVSAYDRLEQLGALLETAMQEVAKSANVPVVFNRCGSMFCAYFTSEPVWNLADAMKSDRERFKKFFHGMLDAGIYLAPSQFEAGFLSTAHSEADIEVTVNAAAKAMKTL
jgi:glutamate-1-semialdehyde 2,1-aminomutase